MFDKATQQASGLSLIGFVHQRRWKRVWIEGWYRAQPREVELCSATALWYYSGTVVPIRWVLLRDPEKRFDPQALLCTDLS